MTIKDQLQQLSLSRDTAVTIGTFDGVHLGHQHLINATKETARARGLEPAVLSFRNAPRSVLRPDSQVRYITPLDERLSLIRDQGVSVVVDVDFTQEVSQIKAEEFVSLLQTNLGMKALVVGPDFAIGYRREGNVSTLKALGESTGFDVEQVDPVDLDGEAIHTGAIRELIAQGNVEKASRMLGRSFSLSGTIVEGDRRGRTIGFPTANLSVADDIAIPMKGIYATWAVVEGRRIMAATCIGYRPTFGIHAMTIEAFILNFDEDIYGKPLRLEFVRRIRDEQTFSSVETLVEQMKMDVEQTQDILSTAPSRGAGL